LHRFFYTDLSISLLITSLCYIGSEENQDVTVLDIEDDSAFDDRKNDGKKHVHFSEETITVMIPNPPKGFCDSVKKLLDFVCCCGCCFPNYL
jgi:hypothetical protein